MICRPAFRKAVLRSLVLICSKSKSVTSLKMVMSGLKLMMVPVVSDLPTDFRAALRSPLEYSCFHSFPSR